MAKDFIPDYEQFPSEFLSDGDIYQIFMSNNLMTGRMISGSKSGYMEQYPDNLVVFNANIVIESRGKIWHGDLDITRDYENLEKVSEVLEEPLYILYEMDARFEHENDPVNVLISKAVTKIEYNGNNNRSPK
jgi:hypothetical protein